MSAEDTLNEVYKTSRSKYLNNIKLENEQKVISFLIRNPHEATELREEYFLNPISKALFFGISQIVEKNISLEYDTLLAFSQDKYPNLKYELISEIHDKFTDFVNIDTTKSILINDFKKNRINTSIFEDLLTKTNQKDPLDMEQLREFAENLLFDIVSSDTSIDLFSGKDLAERHLKVIEERDAGLKQKSLGYRCLDEVITRPGAPEEVSILTARKGSGKSIFAKQIENNLISKGVCVLSFNLEMSEASSIDRLLCVREGIPLKELQQKNMNPRLKGIIKNGLDRIAKIENYRYCPNEYLDFPLLDATIYKAKQEFRKSGLLTDDYIFITIDLLDMMQGFDDAKNIKISMDKLHHLARKHKCHFLGVVQANENKFRTGNIIKKPEDLEYYKVGMEDIFGGSSYAARARVVMTIDRPLFLKKLMFPQFEETWQLEDDILNLNIVKQNDGELHTLKFLFGDNFKITPYKGLRKEKEDSTKIV